MVGLLFPRCDERPADRIPHHRPGVDPLVLDRLPDRRSHRTPRHEGRPPAGERPGPRRPLPRRVRPAPTRRPAFVSVLGVPHVQNYPRFATNADHHASRAELIPLIEGFTAGGRRKRWIAAFQAAGVPCGAIQTYDQVFNDPHLAEREFFWDGGHPTLGQVRQLGSPMRLAETPTRRDSAGPSLGQHSAQVLAEVGYSADQFKELRDRSVTA